MATLQLEKALEDKQNISERNFFDQEQIYTKFINQQLVDRLKLKDAICETMKSSEAMLQVVTAQMHAYDVESMKILENLHLNCNERETELSRILMDAKGKL